MAKMTIIMEDGGTNVEYSKKMDDSITIVEVMKTYLEANDHFGYMNDVGVDIHNSFWGNTRLSWDSDNGVEEYGTGSYNPLHKKGDVKDVNFLIPAEMFGKSAKLILDTSRYAREKLTQRELEVDLKKSALRVIKCIKNNPEGEIISVGSLNYRVSADWFDEETMELIISVSADTDDDLLVEMDLEDLEDQLGAIIGPQG